MAQIPMGDNSRVILDNGWKPDIANQCLKPLSHTSKLLIKIWSAGFGWLPKWLLTPINNVIHYSWIQNSFTWLIILLRIDSYRLNSIGIILPCYKKLCKKKPMILYQLETAETICIGWNILVFKPIGRNILVFEPDTFQGSKCTGLLTSMKSIDHCSWYGTVIITLVLISLLLLYAK